MVSSDSLLTEISLRKYARRRARRHCLPVAPRRTEKRPPIRWRCAIRARVNANGSAAHCPHATRSPGLTSDHRAQHNVADGGVEHLTARLTLDSHEQTISGDGNGPVDAFVHAVRETYGFDIHVLNYHEHAIGAGEDAAAVSYVQLRVGVDRAVYGVGMDSNIVTATLLAVVSAVNRAIAREWLALPIAVVAA